LMASARFAVTKEEQLLITAAGGRCLPPLDPASPEIRWEKLVTAADWQRLGPLLWEHLRDPSSDLEVPPIALDVLRELARRSTARSLSLSFELDRVLTLLEAEGVPVLLLKGSALV